MNIFQYAAAEEKMWENFLEDLGGNYKRKTTFYADLSIAELYGVKGIKDTYNSVIRNWLSNVEYFSEFVLCLNHKSWEWYDKFQNGEDDKACANAGEISRCYAELYEKAKDKAYETFDEKGQKYLWQILD